MNSSNQSSSNHSKIIIALDFDSIAKAEACLAQLDPKECRIKIGKEMFVGAGPQWVKNIIDKGFEVFLDLKFHDIPNTVYKACVQAAELGVWMVNVHALGGLDMLKKAKEAVSTTARPGFFPPLIIGVTILTSMGEEDIKAVGLQGSVEENVLRLAKLCHIAGLDGVVCSAWEASKIKSTISPSFLCVTPGIRFESSVDDQKRVMTPKAAVEAGADYLVIGRSITQAQDPGAVVQQIAKELTNGI